MMRILSLLMLALGCTCLQAQDVPDYRVDAGWPQSLPDNMMLGQVSGIAVDRNDTIWVLHRPRTLSMDDMGAVMDPPTSLCCQPAPSVLQFNQAGELLQAWGGPVWNTQIQDARLPETDWPLNEHGIFVDEDDYVWIGGNQDAGGKHIVVKYTMSGEYVMTLGIPGETGGSNDPERLGRPADIAVDTSTREVFIADGYLNRRVIVFDSITGAYKRHWGAYSNTPDDAPLPTHNPEAPPEQQFTGPVHGVVLGPENQVYVADRTGNRIQVFQRSGAFIEEKVVAPETLANGSVWDLAISSDERGQWLFVADGANRRVWILDRESLDVVGSFGGGGRQAGQFDWLHNIALDSAGNIYTAEVNNGRRIQKFSAR